MSNSKMDSAEIDALLTGGTRAVNKWLIIGVMELTTSVDSMRAVCEERGRTCPGRHACIADPVDPAQLRILAAEKARGVVQTAKGVAGETLHTAEGVALELAETTYRTRTMWALGVGFLERLVLPVIVSIIAVLATLLLTGKL